MAWLAFAALLLGIGIQAALAARPEINTPAVEESVFEEPAQTPTAERVPAPAAWDILILVNRWHPVPEAYMPVLEDIGEGYALDIRCADALLQMLQDCREAGNHPIVCSAYRGMDEQQELYDNRIRRYVDEGVDPEEAPALAARSVALPGTSEHQLGLAVDIIDENYVILDAGQEETSTQKWLMENCLNYGFILRYPNGTTEITGIIYEPWHYRYVGVEAAAEIHALGLTLEEYTERKER